MPKVIQQSSLLLIKILALFCLCSCNDDVNSAQSNPYKTYQKGTISLPSGSKVTVYIAQTPQQQRLGLSFVKENEFKSNEGMLFPAKTFGPRQFWMPNTYFNLDIFFLNEDMYVLDVHRNLEHYPKATPKNKVPLSKKVRCSHVLEIKADSPLAKEIQPGMLLNWSAPKSL